MGHEGTGVVEQLGPGVETDSLGTSIKKGDRIVYAAVFPCYRCHLCLKGDTNWCINRGAAAAGIWPYFRGTYADFLATAATAISANSYICHKTLNFNIP